MANSLSCIVGRHRINDTSTTMYKLFFILSFTVSTLLISGQVCNHTDLSMQFDIETSLIRIKNDKSAKKVMQTINYSSIHFSDKVFIDCNSVISYPAKKNDTLDIIDNYYGDLIVADFNFDNRDDFALIKDSGSNGGPFYDFYIQNKN